METIMAFKLLFEQLTLSHGNNRPHKTNTSRSAVQRQKALIRRSVPSNYCTTVFLALLHKCTEIIFDRFSLL